ncbi:hypothetical protein GCM10023149_27240 [Mucilaginibacter gynuensis]|uniref:DUF4286 family protein n=1 Tax=Mucilaginibacter gynuensis TaxID=1302236 RepID=A0ABP8GIQ4_9SPHI
MIIYNETIIVEETTHQEWLTWIQQTHIPKVMETGLFTSFRILTVLDSPNEGVTYCIQYDAENMDNVGTYYNNHHPDIQAAHQQKFENKFVMFSTLMQEV